MNTLKMLALREWMQHGRAWLLLAGVPLLLVALAVAVGHVTFTDGPRSPAFTPAAVLYMATGGCLAGMCALAVLVAGLKVPGLALRDVQDRSIEFWLSLPVGHWRAVLVPTVMLLVAMPLLFMLLSLMAAPLLGGTLVLRVFGADGLAQMDWGSYLTALATLGLRMGVGIVVGALWLAPLVAVCMAVSAWLKYWGLVVFFTMVFVGAPVLDIAYEIHGPKEALIGILKHTFEAYSMMGYHESTMPQPELMGHSIGFADVSKVLLTNIRELLASMASLPFLGGLAVAVAGTWTQVLRRQRG